MMRTIVEPKIYRPTPREIDFLVTPHSSLENTWLVKGMPSGVELYSGPLPWPALFRNHVVVGTSPVIGMRGTVPDMKLSIGSSAEICYLPGDWPISAVFLNVDDPDPAMIKGVYWGDQRGPIHDLAFFGVDIMNEWGNPACMGSTAHARELGVFDCAFVPDTTPDQWGNVPHISGAKWGMHFSHGIDRFHWADTRHIEGSRYKEHLCYPHSLGDAWVCRNNMKGGNRTGTQFRANTSEPQGVVPYGEHLFQNNYADDFGMDWVDPTQPGQGGGGGIITQWCNPDHLVIIEGNRFERCRYAGIVVVAAPDSFKNEHGYSHKGVIVRHNVVTQHLDRTDSRVPVELGGAVYYLELERNRFEGTHTSWDLVLNGQWPAEMGAIPNRRNVLRGGIDESVRVGTYDYATNHMRDMSQEELRLLFAR